MILIGNGVPYHLCMYHRQTGHRCAHTRHAATAVLTRQQPERARRPTDHTVCSCGRMRVVMRYRVVTRDVTKCCVSVRQFVPVSRTMVMYYSMCLQSHCIA